MNLTGLWSYPLSPTEEYVDHLARIANHIQTIFNNKALVINTNTNPIINTNNINGVSGTINSNNNINNSVEYEGSLYNNNNQSLSSASITTTSTNPSAITSLTNADSINNSTDDNNNNNNNNNYLPSTNLSSIQQFSHGQLPIYLQSHNRTCTIWSQEHPTVGGKGGGCLTPKTALLPHHKEWLSNQTQQPNLLMPITCPLNINTNNFFTTYLSNDYDNIFMTIPYCPDTTMLHELQFNTDIRDVKQLTYNLLRQYDLTTPSSSGATTNNQGSVLPQILPAPSSLPLHYIENYIRTVTSSLGGELVKYDRKMLSLLSTMNELNSTLIQTFTINKDLIIQLPMVVPYLINNGDNNYHNNNNNNTPTSDNTGNGNVIITIGRVMTEGKLTNTIIIEIELLHFNQINIDPLVFHTLFNIIHPDSYKILWQYANTPFGPSKMYTFHDFFLGLPINHYPHQQVQFTQQQYYDQDGNLLTYDDKGDSNSDSSSDDDDEYDYQYQDINNVDDNVDIKSMDDIDTTTLPITIPKTTTTTPTSTNDNTLPKEQEEDKKEKNNDHLNTITSSSKSSSKSSSSPTTTTPNTNSTRRQREYYRHYTKQQQMIQYLLNTVQVDEYKRLYTQHLLPDHNPYGGSVTTTSTTSTVMTKSNNNNNNNNNNKNPLTTGNDINNMTSVFNLKNDYTYQLYGRRLEEYGWYQNRLLLLAQRIERLKIKQIKRKQFKEFQQKQKDKQNQILKKLLLSAQKLENTDNNDNNNNNNTSPISPSMTDFMTVKKTTSSKKKNQYQPDRFTPNDQSYTKGQKKGMSPEDDDVYYYHHHQHKGDIKNKGKDDQLSSSFSSSTTGLVKTNNNDTNNNTINDNENENVDDDYDYEDEVNEMRINTILQHNPLDFGQYNNDVINRGRTHQVIHVNENKNNNLHVNDDQNVNDVTTMGDMCDNINTTSTMGGAGESNQAQIIDNKRTKKQQQKIIQPRLTLPPPLRTNLITEDYIHGICILPQMTTLFLQYRLDPIVFHPEHLALMYTQIFLHPHETTL